jgi:predicted RNase H-like nuclease (RuvC/YqgF family)
MSDFWQGKPENSEYSRLLQTESTVDNLEKDLTEIKDTVKRLCSQLSDIALSMNTVVLKLDERDKRSQENSELTKKTFERFGSKIDNLEQKLNETELKMVHTGFLEQKIIALEKLIYWAGSAIATAMGAILFWFIQNTLHPNS